MNTNSVLLAYASRFGSTQEAAEAIAAVLRDSGLKVDVLPARDVISLDAYAAVVLGAALYNARWHADAHHFLSRHRDTLKHRPVAIFTLGPVVNSSGAMKNSRRQLDKELEKHPWLAPIAVEVFAGKFDPSKPGLGFFDRLMPASDHRDWAAMRAWANAISAQLRQGAAYQHA
jgi:menaquinone-dependent protoporphyrinogen oxidase